MKEKRRATCAALRPCKCRATPIARSILAPGSLLLSCDATLARPNGSDSCEHSTSWMKTSATLPYGCTSWRASSQSSGLQARPMCCELPFDGCQEDASFLSSAAGTTTDGRRLGTGAAWPVRLTSRVGHPALASPSRTRYNNVHILEGSGRDDDP